MLAILAPELTNIFRSWYNGDVAAADQWARRIHSAFYSTKSTRGSNKFLALKSTLTEVFRCLSPDEDPQGFWNFVVCVVLILAQEPTFDSSEGSREEECILTGKKNTKKCQPNAPLAFVVLNALKTLASGDGSSIQAEQCRLQGKHNKALRELCTRGLDNDPDIDQKLLVELLELFQIVDIDLGLVRRALDRLLETKSHAALIKLCGTFTDVDWPFKVIVTRMVRAKDWTSAEQLVRTYETEGDTVLAKLLINETINLRDFKRAHRLVSNFKLQKEYPDIDILYSRDGLMRLIETERWQLALTFVGHDTTLQKVLLEHMAAAGELDQATQLIKKMEATGFKPDISQILENQIVSTEIASASDSSQHTANGRKFLILPLDGDDIVFCDSEAVVRQAMNHFFGSSNCGDDQSEVGLFSDASQIVGLDVEWKPVMSRSKSRTAVASILQIASSTRVFIIDLLTLHDNDYLFDNFLVKLLKSAQILKIGFSFDSDLKVLNQTFPERQAFMAVAPFLDLNALTLKSGDPMGTSLSQVVNHILGKPLDKRMQLSDWEQRPLSSDQLTYAALDAFCLVKIAGNMHGQREDNSLPRWQEVCEQIGNLSGSRPLTEAETLEATSLRLDYQKKWLLHCAAEDNIQSSTPLLMPQDLVDFWEERKVTARKCFANATLTFLPMDRVKALLEEPAVPDVPQNFITINSICIFADNTPCVVCIDASCKLDMAQFGRFCGVGRRKVRLATASECREVFGFAPGTVAPFGHGSQVPTSNKTLVQPREINVYAETCLQTAQYLVAGCGSQDEAFWVESKSLFGLVSIKLIDDISIRRDSSPPRSLAAESNRDHCNVIPGGVVEEDPQTIEYKFLADSMVTQLGRWLRTIGVDVVNWNPDDVRGTRTQDPKSIMLGHAAKEDRIVLTRDTHLPSRRDAGACFVLSDHECYKQFREVKVQFGLLERMGTRSSRCARCNSAAFSLIDCTLARKKVSERVRKKIPNSVTKFWICNGCSKVYWEGPKYTPSMSSGSKPRADGSVVYRPVPRKRVAGDGYDQRHLPEVLS